MDSPFNSGTQLILVCKLKLVWENSTIKINYLDKTLIHCRQYSQSYHMTLNRDNSFEININTVIYIILRRITANSGSFLNQNSLIFFLSLS